MLCGTNWEACANARKGQMWDGCDSLLRGWRRSQEVTGPGRSLAWSEGTRCEEQGGELLWGAERSRSARPHEADEFQNWVCSDDGGFCSSPGGRMWGCLIWVEFSELPSLPFPSTYVLSSLSSLQEGLPCCSCAGDREVWLVSLDAEYGSMSCIPHLSCAFCLGLAPLRVSAF